MGATNLTIRTLLETSSLQLKLLCGKGGLDRSVAWTHVSELEDPAPWLDGGELLMTNGLGLPADGDAQRRLVERLVERHVAGLAIGVRGPALQPEMQQAADELAFPILRIPLEVPFLSIARMVADANQNDAHQRLVTHLRIFDTLRTNGQEQTTEELFSRLEQISGYDVYLLSSSGSSLIRTIRTPPKEVLGVLGGDAFAPNAGNPAIPGGYVVPVPIQHRCSTFLVAMERQGAELAGLGAVRHMATIAALELSKLYYEREANRRRGAEALAKLFAGRLDTPSAEAALAEAGLDPSAPLMVSALSAEESELYDNELHHRLCDLAVPHMLLADQCVQVLLPGVDDVISSLAAAVKGLPLVAGVSDFHTGVNSWPVARKEAIWALEQGMPTRDGDQIQRFSPSESHAHWLPTDIDTLEGLVNGILAPVIEYDRKHNSDLLLTLRAFFQHDRSVKSAAAELYVHKHTLAYRLNRIEDITGRNLSSTADIAQLWLALQAFEIVGSHHDETN